MSVIHLRRQLLFRVLATFLPAAPGLAQSPADLPLREADITRVECRWDRDESLPGFEPGKGPQKGVWHYDVFIPKGYAAETKRRYPCLFIASPGGEAKNSLPLYKDWLVRNEWLAVMLVESRNGPHEPCLGNFLSAHDDAIRRLRIIDTMKAAAGMSGAARMSSLFVQVRPGFRGLFLQAAGFGQSNLGNYWMQHLPAEGSFAVFLALGNKDPNTVEIEILRNSFAPGVPWFSRLFDGGHVGPPKEIAVEGMDWLAHRMWLTASTDKSVRAQAPAVVKRLASYTGEAASPAARFALLQKIADLVKACDLARHPDIAPLMTGFSEEFTALKKDPDVILEIKASTALTTMYERRKQTAIKASKLKDAPAKKALWLEFGAACQEAAAPFPDTRAGKECRLLGEGMSR